MTGTAVNCEDGHCLHGGTAVGSFYCCKCGSYIGYTTPYSEVYRLTQQEHYTNNEGIVKMPDIMVS